MMTFFISSCCDKIRTESEVNARLYNSAKKEIVELNDKTDTLNARLDNATGVENYKNNSPETKNQFSSGMTDEESARKVFIICKVFVKGRLVSPISADFPFQDYKFSKVTNNTIVVESYVDSENEYGAEIRSNYKIRLKLIGSDWGDEDNWEVISLGLY